ncbi:cytochrome b [Mycobacterium parmense]|uniref:Cytochrome b n=1 Tax=Mycobacterium parmense TaxID=185642 RepID=A0A7I7YYZ7_9MYCO|nr:cytochrome b/b6 domain-containing protein [Mycobacterium parmense]MCV7349932.1 cytochrome b [Mycobacterium parmense]ORW59226.1 cytochrome B [Mycobacterium parmense]BBZ46537.1 cytochrome b [Mycobacterium parmense]
MTADPATTGATSAPVRFAVPSRILHWLMAPMVIAQLLIGVTMIASLTYYPLLLAIHRPLGMLILVFAVVRLANRLTHRLPPFLATMSAVERRVATWSEYLLYALLLVQPLVGWAMLSAARLPTTLVGPLHLPGVVPQDIDVYAVLRQCHTIFAFLLFLTFTAHVCAVLFHTLVLRDGLLDRMAVWPAKPVPPRPGLPR